jgi:hypothetical protein
MALLGIGWLTFAGRYDNCFNEGQAGTQKLSHDRYNVMSEALLATGRNITYSLCNWGDDVSLPPSESSIGPREVVLIALVTESMGMGLHDVEFGSHEW